jgi:pyruvate dehydrogenase E2 component (dihydrolipoamide acetyltransferase)
MDTLTQIAVPDIGDFADVPVIEILVSVGDAIAIDDPLLVIESDKATMELPSPVVGVVREILVAVGDTVSEGTPIISVEVSSEAALPAEDRGGEPSPSAHDAAAAAPGAAAQPGSPANAAEVQGLARETTAASGEPPVANSAAPPSDWSAVYAGPAVRRLARERGIDLRTVRGSGRRGRITLDDLERPPSPNGTSAGDAEGLRLAPWPSIDFARYGEVERVPLTRVQRLASAYLARNWVRIPHVTHSEEADVTELEAFRRQLNSEQSEVKVTMVALLLKAAAAALEAYPRFNSSLDGEKLVLKRYYHLGFAADTPQGLVVPVIRDVNHKGLLELAGELAELSGKAREGRLSSLEMSGATFTISSLGGIGGTSFTPIVNAPEVAILGVVRAVMKPVWDGQQFQPRRMLPLSLSYDHRVIDGAAAARFCVHLAGLLADMRRVLL